MRRQERRKRRHNDINYIERNQLLRKNIENSSIVKVKYFLEVNIMMMIEFRNILTTIYVIFCCYPITWKVWKNSLEIWGGVGVN